MSLLAGHAQPAKFVTLREYVLVVHWIALRFRILLRTQHVLNVLAIRAPITLRGPRRHVLIAHPSMANVPLPVTGKHAP